MTVRMLLLARKVPIAFATFNPSDKHADITLSGGNLTAQNTGGTANAAVRSTVGKSSGKYYWEVVSTDTGGASSTARAGIGIGSSTQNLNAGGGFASLEGLRVYYGENGNKYQPSTAMGATFTAGDVIGCKLDMDAGTFEVLKNNTSQGTIVTGLTGTIYAYVLSAVSGSGPYAVITARFGATAFTYSVPSGYQSGLF